MEELDLLKKHWKKEIDFPKISQKELREIIHKKSSSVVKWIMIISIAELLVGLILSFVVNIEDEKSTVMIEENSFLNMLSYCSNAMYVVVIYFIYKFYKMYKKITVEDNTNQLMENIIQTKKVVRQYMLFNVTTFFILCLCISWVTLQNEIFNKGLNQHHLSSLQFILTFGVMVLVIAVCTYTFWLIYKLIYGYFLRKLQRNYNELKSIENENV